MNLGLSYVNTKINGLAFAAVDRTRLVSNNLGKDLGWLIKLRCAVRSSGFENIPLAGPYIIAVNHLRGQTGLVRPVYDALVVSKLLYDHNGRNIRWLARPTMAFDLPRIGRRIPLPLRDMMCRVFEEKYGAVMVDTVSTDESRQRLTGQSVQALLADNLVGVTPEGDMFDALAKAKKGLFYIARAYFQVTGRKVAIVPCAIWGTERGRSCGRRRLVELVVEPALYLDPDGDPQIEVDKVMISIASALPERYRGFYADRVT